MTRNYTLIAAVLLVIAAVWMIANGFRHVERVAEIKAERHPRYELVGAEWTRYDAQGKPQLHATADTIRYYDDKSAELDDLNLDQLGATPGPWHLTSPHGMAPANEERMQLTQPVKMRGSLRDGEPIELTADTLWVDYTTREIYTDSPVNVVAPYRSVDAVGMRADWAGTRLQLLDRVKVTYATRS